MDERMSSLIRRSLAFAAPVALGATALILMQRARSEPKERPPSEQGRAVRVLEVQSHEAVPRAVGYGVARSQREWKLVAEVSGRVIELDEQLQTGRIIRKGTKLIKIDPEDYELVATQQEATVEGVEAQLAELGVKERSTRASLKIAKRSLALTRKDLGRVQQLFAGGNATAAEVDDTDRQVLSQETTVQNLQNTLAEIPASRRRYRAQIDQYEAGVAGAQLDISRTEILAPFDLRIRSVDVELSELVSVGTVLAEGDGIATAEVPAQFPIGSLQPLIPPRPGDAPVTTQTLDRLRNALGIQARVRLESGGVVAQWTADFDRFGNVDSETRTVGVVVTVEEPYKRAKPGVQPPLISGMYVEVELRGRPRPGCLAVPRSALRGKELQVVGAEQRLETREVEVAFLQDAYACVVGGLEEGEQVVLTELVPAIEGMLLEPRVDEQAVAGLEAAVRGEEPSE